MLNLMQTVSHLTDPVVSVFFISLFSPLSNRGFVGNSDRKRFALCSSFNNLIVTFSAVMKVTVILWQLLQGKGRTLATGFR